MNAITLRKYALCLGEVLPMLQQWTRMDEVGEWIRHRGT